MKITPWHELRRNNNRPLRAKLGDFFFYRRYAKRQLEFKQMSPFRHFLQDVFEFIFPGFCREIRRKELVGVVDRMGGDGPYLYLSGESLETCEKEIMGMLRMHEERVIEQVGVALLEELKKQGYLAEGVEVRAGKVTVG